MRLLRLMPTLVLFLSLLVLGSTPLWAGERPSYDDVWWKEQYKKIYDRPACENIIPNMDKIREFDGEFDSLNAPILWALGLYLSTGECSDANPDEALAILTGLAERGESISAIYLAQFYHIKFGANAPLTRSWMVRAKNVMPYIIGEDWRNSFFINLWWIIFKRWGRYYHLNLKTYFHGVKKS